MYENPHLPSIIALLGELFTRERRALSLDDDGDVLLHLLDVKLSPREALAPGDHPVDALGPLVPQLVHGAAVTVVHGKEFLVGVGPERGFLSGGISEVQIS